MKVAKPTTRPKRTFEKDVEMAALDVPAEPACDVELAALDVLGEEPSDDADGRGLGDDVADELAPVLLIATVMS